MKERFNFKNINTLGGKNILRIRNAEVMYADIPGNNRNFYSSEEVEKGVGFWKKLVNQDPTFRYIYIKHPKDDSEESFEYVAGYIEDLRFDKKKKTVFGDLLVLNTYTGLLIRYLIDNKLPVGLSIRGSGTPIKDFMNDIQIVRRENFKLRGLDFVVYPSFVTTRIKDSNVVTEQFKKYIEDNSDINDRNVLDTYFNQIENVCESCSDGSCDFMIQDEEKILDDIEFINLEKIEKTYENTKKEKKDFGGLVMSDQLEIKEKELKAKELDLEISELERKKAELDSINSKYEEVSEKLSEEEEKLDNTLGLNYKYEQKKNSLENEIKELENKFESLKLKEKSIKGEVYEDTNLNKTFSLENKPSIRVIKPSEKVSEKELSDEEIEKAKHIIYFSGDEKIVKESFGYSHIGDDDIVIKYPLYEVVESKSDYYDYDLLLNKTLLENALNDISGENSLNMDVKEKNTIVDNLSDKYQTLVDNEIQESVPEFLTNVKESRDKELNISCNDSFISSIFTNLIGNGHMKEVFEKLAENNEDEEGLKIEINDENVNKVYENISNSFINLYSDEKVRESLIKTLKEYDVKKISDEVNEKSSDEFDAYMKTFFNKLVFFPNTADKTSFAEQYGISTMRDFGMFFVNMSDNFASLDIATGLQMIKDAIMTAGINKMVEESNTEFMSVNDSFKIFEAMENCFMGISFALNNLSMFSLEEKSDNFEDDKQKSEKTNENNKKEQEELVMEKLQEKVKNVIDLVKEKYDVDGDITEDNFDEVISAFVEEYTSVSEKAKKFDEVSNELNQLKLKDTKEETIKDLTDNYNYDEESVRDTVEECTDADEIDRIYKTLTKVKVKSPEETPEEDTKEKTNQEDEEEKETVTEKRKGLSQPDEDVKEKTSDKDEISMKNFKSMFKKA